MNKYLLDTHTALWALGEDSKLSQCAKDTLGDSEAGLFISVVSAWEVTIKISLGKLRYQGGVQRFLEQLKNAGLIILPIEENHLIALEKLAYIHRDPFDRLLIVTALTEGMTILTADEKISQYEVPTLW